MKILHVIPSVSPVHGEPSRASAAPYAQIAALESLASLVAYSKQWLACELREKTATTSYVEQREQVARLGLLRIR
jgi:hypothetical protein